MFDTKFIVTLTALIVAVFAICNFDNKKVTSFEKFGMLPSRVTKVDTIIAPNKQDAARGQFSSMPGWAGGTAKGDFFSVPGTFQAALSPRFANMNVGANIRYNPPAMKNMAAPCDPLTYGNMARENFTTKEDYGCNGCNSGLSCRKGGEPGSFHGGAPLMPANYTNGNRVEIMDQVRDMDQSSFSTNMLPVDTMATVNELGELEQPIVYDRLMFANRNSRLRSQGDMIRGDLPIVPCVGGWFNVSVQPNIDLQQGAMNVLAGANNEVTQALTELVYRTSGNSSSTIAGSNMSSMRNSTLSAGGADVNVTAFP